MNEVEIPIKQHMERSALDYAMSVITSRALPDVRDGLKPVHRRILWAMRGMGMSPEKQTKKSAGVVGEVLKLYHPHGDASVYDAAVRMAQPWSMLHPLILGQGNFGSIDGDNAAAYRYTEMKLSPLAMRFFEGIDKDAVVMTPNFDGQGEEPTILPVSFPAILVNGSDGIAVGMTTSVPPHNLREVCAAMEVFLENPNVTVSELCKIIKAPDFPNGGIVHGLDGFAQAMETGKGRVLLRSIWEEEKGKTKNLLIIRSIPYQGNKAKIYEAIGGLVNDKKLDGVSDVRDESSNKLGIRLVLELKKGINAELIFNQLIGFKVGLEVGINYNMMLLDGNQPLQMGLLDIFRRWVSSRIEQVRRSTNFDLRKAENHLHILKGYTLAIEKMDEVIRIIRAADTPDTARTQLTGLLSVDEAQANAILSLTLRRLTGLELKSTQKEYDETEQDVKGLQAILASQAKQIRIVRDTLRKTVSQFGMDRKTTVEYSLNQLTREDLIEREDAILITTANGYVKRVAASSVDRQNRGTRGKSWMSAGDGDTIESLHVGSTHDYLLVLTSTGKIYSRKVYEIPEGNAGSKGRHIRNIIAGIGESERLVKMLTITDFNEEYSLITATQKGQIKRTKLSEYPSSGRDSGVIALVLDTDDTLASVAIAKDDADIMLVASNGKTVRFSMGEQLRSMGRASMGNRGIKLEEGSSLVGMAVIPKGTNEDKTFLFCMGANAVGKKTPLSEFQAHARGTVGVTSFGINSKTGDLVKALSVDDSQDLVLISQKGVSNRIDVAKIRKTGRLASGVNLMNLDKGDRIAEVSLVISDEEESNGGGL